MKVFLQKLENGLAPCFLPSQAANLKHHSCLACICQFATMDSPLCMMVLAAIVSKQHGHPPLTYARGITFQLPVGIRKTHAETDIV